MAPIALALAAAPVAAHMPGKPFLGEKAVARTIAFSMRNRMDERYDMVRTARDRRYRYIRNYAPHRFHGQHNAYAWQLPAYQAWEQAHRDGALNESQSHFWREKPAEELYDIACDPHQLVNLADDSAHRQRLTILSRALDRHLVDTNDNGFIPEDAPAEGCRPSRSLASYPRRRVMVLARKAIQRDHADLPTFLAALDDDSEVVRFWAAQGLLMAIALLTDVVTGMSRRLVAEPSPHVGCVLAEAVGLAGHGTAATAALQHILSNSVSGRVKLQALQALTALPSDIVACMRASIEAAGRIDEYTSGAANFLLLQVDESYTPASKTLTFRAPPTAMMLKQLSEPRI